MVHDPLAQGNVGGARAGVIETTAWHQSSIVGTVEPVGDVLTGWARIPDENGLYGPGGGGSIQAMARAGATIVAVGNGRLPN